MVDVRRKSVSELQTFPATAPLELEGSIQQTSQLAGLELRYGLEQNGMRRMYRMRRMNADNVESASALVLTFVSVSPRLPNMEESLDVAGPGTSLTLEDDKGVVHALTIDPVELPRLPPTNEFKRASDPEAVPFIGTKTGETVSIDGAFGTTRTFTVKAISSAYRRVHSRAYAAVTESVTPVPNLVSFSVAESPNGEADFSEMLAQLQRSSAHGRAVLQQYETHPLTLGCLGKMLGKKPIDLVSFWPSKGPALVSCNGTMPERMTAAGLIEDSTLAFVIDSATLAELVFLDSTAVLAQFPNLYISELSRDIVKGMLEEAKQSRSVGHAYDDDGKLRFIEHTEETHKREVVVSDNYLGQ